MANMVAITQEKGGKTRKQGEGWGGVGEESEDDEADDG